MIGGCDIILAPYPGSIIDPAVFFQRAVKALLRVWPGALIEDANSDKVWGAPGKVPWGKVEELFVYRSLEALQSCERLGADPSNANQMVHFMNYEDRATTPGEITVVVGDPEHPEMKMFLESVRSLR